MGRDGTVDLISGTPSFADLDPAVIELLAEGAAEPSDDHEHDPRFDAVAALRHRRSAPDQIVNARLRPGCTTATRTSKG